MTYTAREKAKEANRELAQRLVVYPRLIEQQRLTLAKADRQVAIMKEIADDYENLAAKERLL